jgi:FkbM family methyltransferase
MPPLLKVKGVRHLMKRLFPDYEVALPDNSRFIINEHEKYVLDEVYWRDIYEERKHLNPGDVVVDVGANIGIFSIKASKEVGGRGMVLAIEPDRKNLNRLNRNIALNAANNIRVFSCAAGSAEDMKTLLIKQKGSNSSFFETSEPVSERLNVSVRTIDGIIDEAGLRRCNFLKIDTEGSELEVLKGGMHILTNLRPRVAMETHPFGAQTEQVVEFLREFGYSTGVEPHRNGTSIVRSEPQ